MKFKGSDICFEDYARRRSALIKWVRVTEPDVAKRTQRIITWIRQNTPFEPQEQLANLMNSLKDEDLQ